MTVNKKLVSFIFGSCFLFLSANAQDTQKSPESLTKRSEELAARCKTVKGDYLQDEAVKDVVDGYRLLKIEQRTLCYKKKKNSPLDSEKYAKFCASFDQARTCTQGLVNAFNGQFIGGKKQLYYVEYVKGTDDFIAHQYEVKKK